MSTTAALYDSDYQAWLDANIDLLKRSRFQELEVEHLIEEIADMGKKDRAELANRLVVLIAHLLKWQYLSNYLIRHFGLMRIEDRYASVAPRAALLQILLQSMMHTYATICPSRNPMG